MRRLIQSWPRVSGLDRKSEGCTAIPTDLHRCIQDVLRYLQPNSVLEDWDPTCIEDNTPAPSLWPCGCVSRSFSHGPGSSLTCNARLGRNKGDIKMGLGGLQRTKNRTRSSTTDLSVALSAVLSIHLLPITHDPALSSQPGGLEKKAGAFDSMHIKHTYRWCPLSPLPVPLSLSLLALF